MKRTGQPSWVVSVWCLMLLWISGAVCHAQSPQYIAPAITSDDLDEYAAILELSDAQRAAIEPLFSDYKERYKALHDGEATALMERLEAALNEYVRNSTGGGDGAYFEPSEVRERIRSIERLRSHHESIERTFFETWQNLLTDEQSARLPVVIDLRARHRDLNRYGPIAMTGGAPDGGLRTNLRQLVRALQPTTEQREAIEPLLRAHEARLTAALRTYVEGCLELEEEEDFRGTLPTVIEVGAPVLLLHRQTMESVLPLLDRSRAKMLREETLYRLYPGVLPDPKDATRILDHIDGSRLDENQRTQLAALHESHESAHAALDAQIMKLIDEARRDPEFWMPENPSRPPRINRKIYASLNERTALNTTTLEQAEEFVGREFFSRANDALPEQPTHFARYQYWLREPLAAYSIRFGDWDAQFWNNASPLGLALGSRWIFAPPPDRVDMYCNLLGCSDEQREQIVALDEQLTADIGELREQWTQRHDAAKVVWNADESGRVGVPPEDQAMQSVESDRQMRASADAAQVAFLDGVQALLDESQLVRMPLVRASHLRWSVRRARLIMGLVELGAIREGDTIDLLDPVLDLPDDAIETDAMWALLTQYEDAAAALAQAIDAATSRATEIGYRMMLDRHSFDGEWNRFDLSADTPEGKALLDACLTYRNKGIELRDLNQRTLPQIKALLPEELRGVFEDQVHRAMLPEVYRDDSAVHDTLTQAFELESLTNSQRDRLVELRLSYGQAYRDVTERAFEAALAGRGMNAYMVFTADGRIEREDDAAYRAASDATRRYYDLRTEREELNASSKRQLGFILTEAQRRELGMEDNREMWP